MPVAAADVPRTTTWQPGPDRAPRVTVRGETPRPQSVAVVFDCSGSMGQRTSDGRTRLEAGRAALTRVIDQLAGSGHWRVSLWLYGHRTRWSRDQQGRYTAGLTALGEKAEADAARGGRPFTLVPGGDVEQVLTMQELTGAVVAQIQDTLAPLEPGGETPLYLAISEAVGNDFGGGREDTPGYVLVVTDGANDQTGGRYVTAAAVEDQIARLNGRRRERLRVDVIGFALGMDTSERASRMDDVRNLATTTGGRFYEAADATALVRALRESLRMLHWQVRGPNAPNGSQPLGSSVDLPMPPSDTEVTYDALLEAGAVAPLRRFGVHAGDAIDLYATVGGRALEFRRYDGGTEQGIRDARSPVLDPLQQARRSFVAAHMAQRSGVDIRFPVSIQNADPTQFSPRPTELWFEVRPLGEGGAPLPPFVFYDPSYQGGRTVPVLDLVAAQWPAAATQAEIRGWFRFDTTAPDLTVDLSDIRPGADRTLTVPNLADLTLTVSVGTPDANGMVGVSVVEIHPAAVANQLPRLRLTATGDVRRATHVVESSSGRVRHEFMLQGTAAGLPSDAVIAVTDRQRIISGACALTADGSPPLRVTVPPP
ncbi:MAG: VWA domain-containing protein [Planctomycetes bacterium]|nr:VWA domain-containing protein [Planctomycetota bacterium]